MICIGLTNAMNENKEIKKVLLRLERIKRAKTQEKICKSSTDFIILAEHMFLKGDKVNAKAFLKIAEEKAKSSEELYAVASSINNPYGDKKWAKKIYMKIEAKAKTFEDFQRLAFYVSCFDENWSNRLFEKANDIYKTKKTNK